MSWLLQNKYDDMDISSVSEKITNELLERGLVFKDPAKIATGKPYAATVTDIRIDEPSVTLDHIFKSRHCIPS